MRFIRISIVSFLCHLLLLSPFRRDSRELPIGGTALLFYADDERLIVAADSKMTPINTAEFQGMDLGQACKIVELDSETLFFYAGGLAEIRDLGGTHAVRFSAKRIALNAFQKYRREHRSAQRLSNMANLWGKLMTPEADATLKKFGSDQFQNEMGWGAFGGLDDSGKPVFMIANMGFRVATDGSARSMFNVERGPPDAAHPLAETPSAASSVNEFLLAQTDRAKTANLRFNMRFKKELDPFYISHRYAAALEAAIEWHPENPSIGLPVDLVELKRDGHIVWLKRKPHCSE
jgi:hypothetical protein